MFLEKLSRKDLVQKSPFFPQPVRVLCGGGAMVKKRRFESIQVLRFIAASFVVAIHFSLELNKHVSHKFIILDGNSGVDIFFVISGFVIALTSGSCSGGIDFLRRRIFRVVPLYWTMTIAVFTVAYFSPSVLYSTKANPLYLLKSLLFIPFAKEKGLIEPVLNVGWTLNYEMFFYIVFAICLSLCRKPIIAVSGFFVVLVIIGWMFVPQNLLIIQFYTNGIILEFVAGMWIYEFYSLRNFSHVTFSWIIVFIGAAGLLCQMIYFIDFPREIKFGIFSAILVFGAVSLPFVKNTILASAVLLGDASYSLYLIHQFFSRTMGLILHRLGIVSLVYVDICVALFVIATMICSLVIYRLFERPSTDFLNNMWRKRFVRSALTSEPS
jgi:peptidoglycan/LPS O-acetylase OafA/YrhL